jgi:hypothetical protein
MDMAPSDFVLTDTELFLVKLRVDGIFARVETSRLN